MWIKATMADGDIHVTPVNDLIDHELSEDCICGPEPELLENGKWMYAHESLDRREDSE